MVKSFPLEIINLTDTKALQGLLVDTLDADEIVAKLYAACYTPGLRFAPLPTPSILQPTTLTLVWRTVSLSSMNRQ